MKYRPTGHGFEDYYLHQLGHGPPAFVGTPMQRGHGIGNVLKGLFKVATPLLKTAGKQALKQALSTGVNVVASELSKPHRHPIVRTGARLLQRAVSSRKRPRTTPRRKPAKRTKRRKTLRPDIFS